MFPRYNEHERLYSSVFHVFLNSSASDDDALAQRGYGDLIRYTQLLHRPAFEFRLARGDSVLRASAPDINDALLMYVRRPIAFTRTTRDYVFPWQLDDTLRFFGRSTHEYVFDGRLDSIMLRDDDATGYVYVVITQYASGESSAILRPALSPPL